MRIVAPTFTQTPNDLFDHWLPRLNETELKVLLVIMRKTFGWNRQRDFISTSQLEKLTGQSHPSILKAVKSLQSKGLISKETEGQAGIQKTYYELVIDDSNNYERGNIVTPPGSETYPPPVSLLPHKTTKIKQPIKKQQQAAAVSSSIYHPLLDPLDIPNKEKKWIVDHYSSNEITQAMKWATHPDTKLTKPLAAAIKWACKALPEISKSKEEFTGENKKYAEKVEQVSKSQQFTVAAFSKDIQITHKSGAGKSFNLLYTDNGFKDKILNELKNKGFNLP